MVELSWTLFYPPISSWFQLFASIAKFLLFTSKTVQWNKLYRLHSLILLKLHQKLRSFIRSFKCFQYRCLSTDRIKSQLTLQTHRVLTEARIKQCSNAQACATAMQDLCARAGAIQWNLNSESTERKMTDNLFRKLTSNETWREKIWSACTEPKTEHGPEPRTWAVGKSLRRNPHGLVLLHRGCEKIIGNKVSETKSET